MASRKITRSAKKSSTAATAPPAKSKDTKAAAPKTPTSAHAAPAALKSLAVRQPSKPIGDQPATSRAAYLEAGLDALVRRMRLHDQAAAKKLEPALAHLAKAYGELLGKG